MEKKSYAFVVLASVLGLQACGGNTEYGDVPAGVPTVSATLRVHVKPDADLDPADALEACEFWSPMGLTCALVDNADNANVNISAHVSPCIASSPGAVTLAHAHGYGTIIVETRCFGRDLVGGIDRLALTAVLAHEIGHELGVWEHVPLDCNEPHKTYEQNQMAVCGVALMNPFYSANVHAITVPDVLAFGLRDTNNSAINRELGVANAGGTSTETLCDYRTQP